MELQQYQISAFTSRQFGGNPAAIVPLAEWLPAEVMLAIAAENNLSETAFYVPEGDGDGAAYGLRWFTPAVEVDLCGHATLGAAHVLFNEFGCKREELRFNTRSGELVVTRSAAGICLDLPAHAVSETTLDPQMVAALGGTPTAAFTSPSNIYLYQSEVEVRALAPDMRALLEASDTTTIVTAPGDEVDFVSRFFAPQVGIDEDPVTGSAHCALTPLWAQRLGKNTLQALQVSSRLGELACELAGDRVRLNGAAITFLRGTIVIEA
ncbi:MAG: PhzF family phenazine biosynthesis protein [Gammaproteobacteria bacterium]|nr:PhzF family phenazine biosynthesis protein [Gammaproteobacteria bacterium]